MSKQVYNNNTLYSIRLNQSFNSDCLGEGIISGSYSFFMLTISLIRRHIFPNIGVFLKLDAFYNEWCFRVNEIDEMPTQQCFSLAPSVGCHVKL